MHPLGRAVELPGKAPRPLLPEIAALAPGAAPIVPGSIPGVRSPNVFTLRNVTDVKAIKAYIDEQGVTRAAVVGGGFIGVEVAENLACAGLLVTLVEGADQVRGVCAAVDYLSASTRTVLDPEQGRSAALDPNGKDVVIVGGGDTGNDCLGVSLRGGCRCVVQLEMLPKDAGKPVIYEPRRQNRPDVKVDGSQEECLSVFGKDPHVYQTTVKSLQTDENGQLQAVVTVDLEPVYDSQRRLTMREIEGTEKVLPCQLLVVAAGFLGPCGYVADAFGVDTDARSNIAADRYATSAAKVYACGDCRTGQSLVVKAMADGRDCAKAVDEALG